MTTGANDEKNPISRLQEICQQRKFPLPQYRECQGTYQMFGTVITLTDLEDIDTVSFNGLARTKKASKTAAAAEALLYIRENKPHLLEPPPTPVSTHLLLHPP